MFNEANELSTILCDCYKNGDIHPSPVVAMSISRNGRKPINNIVDDKLRDVYDGTADFHAYDYDKLRTKLGAAHDGEKVVTHGKEYELTSGDIVIAMAKV